MKKIRLLIYSGEKSWIDETLNFSIPDGSPKMFVPARGVLPPCTIESITDIDKIYEVMRKIREEKRGL